MIDEKTPPGCKPIEGGAAFEVTDMGAFLDAIRPAVEANMARVNDADDERSGDGWSGALTTPACPVQIEGEVDGMRFYFRARGEDWSFSIGRTAEEAVMAGLEDVPDGWSTGGDAEGGDAFAGSWMPYSEAWRHVEASIAAWRAGRGGHR